MMVTNPLQIYAVVIGSKLYDEFFNILTGFGIVFLPLLAAFTRSMQPFLTGESENVTSTSIKQAAFNLGMYFLGFIVLAVPIAPLHVEGITYKPACHPMAEVSTFGNTGTTYDKAFDNIQYEGIRLPLGLMAILTLTSGITNTLMVSLPCKTDVQSMADTIDSTKLTPALAEQVNQFANECFLPAKAEFERQHPSVRSYAKLLQNEGGFSDLNWIGSNVLQTLYYRQLSPSQPVTGFSANNYPYSYQAYNQKAGVSEGKWGYPDCETWFNAPTVGIKAQLVALANARSPDNPHLGELPLSSRLDAWWAKTKRSHGLGSAITPNDIIARGVLSADEASQGGFGDDVNTGWSSFSGFTGGSSSQNGAFPAVPNVSSFTENTAAQVGMNFSRLENTVKRKELAIEIPMMQALLLAFLLMVGALIIVLGGYRLKVVVPYYFLVASTIFVSFIEYFLKYFENSLHASLSYGTYAFGDSAMLYNVFTFLYQYAPVLFLMLMSMTGFLVADAAAQLFSRSQSGSATGLVKKGIGAATGSLINGGG